MTPVSGSIVLDDGNEVWHILAGVPSPTLQLGVGYVWFYEVGYWVGGSLLVQLPDGTEHEGIIVDLPFFYKKRLVKGLDRSLQKRPD